MYVNVLLISEPTLDEESLKEKRDHILSIIGLDSFQANNCRLSIGGCSDGLLLGVEFSDDEGSYSFARSIRDAFPK